MVSRLTHDGHDIVGSLDCKVIVIVDIDDAMGGEVVERKKIDGLVV